jgi:uncharacterized membrane protein
MTTANMIEQNQGTQDLSQQQQQPSQQDDGGPQHEQQQSFLGINVGQQERLISAGAGALLALYGWKRMRLGSLLWIGAGAMLIQRAVSGNCKLYGALGINTAQGDGAAPQEYFNRGVHVEESFTIQKSPEELYAFWRKFDNLPKFMKHLKSVEVQDEKRSHWVADAPMGMSVKWDAEIINDEPNRLIAWRSLGGADVDNAGSVTFRAAPGDRGTEVTVVMDYIPPAGAAGAAVAKLFGKSADSMVRDDLRNFKRLMETGEIASIEGQPRGNCTGGGKRVES